MPDPSGTVSLFRADRAQETCNQLRIA